MIDREQFLARIAERANVPKSDAGALVDAFFRALAQKVDRDTWDTVERIAPLQVDFARPVEDDVESAKDFILELAREESVADERAGNHARAVASAIRSQASEAQLAEIRTAVADEAILALFETYPGELTSTP